MTPAHIQASAKKLPRSGAKIQIKFNIEAVGRRTAFRETANNLIFGYSKYKL